MTGSDLKVLVAHHKYEVTRETKTFLEVRRSDGFTVFLDKYDEGDPNAEMYEHLNAARMTADPEDVILMVGIIRGLQIAQSYHKRENIESEKLNKWISAIPTIRNLVEGNGQRKRQRRITSERLR